MSSKSRSESGRKRAKGGDRPCKRPFTSSHPPSAILGWQWIAGPCAGPDSPRRRIEPGRHHRQDRSVPQHGGRPAGYVAGGGLDLQRADHLRARVAHPATSTSAPTADALLIADAGATGVRTAVTDLRGHDPDTSCGYRSTSRSDPNGGSQRSVSLFDELLEKSRDRSRFRSRHRDRRARPRGLRQRDGGQPAHHDRLGWISDPDVVRRPLRVPGVGGQRRQRDDAG